MSSTREKEILTLLVAQKQVTVRELAQKLYASESSVRRDLARLEAQQLIRRTHGGAVLEENGVSALKIPFALREMEQSGAKAVMAQQAAERIRDYDVLFLDASSSAYRLVPYLASKRHLTVITNGVRTLVRLGELGIRAISTGGRLLPSGYALVGAEAVCTVSHFHANAAFFSCRGLSLDGTATDISDAENDVRQHMIAQSHRAYLMCTSPKIGHTYFHTLCTLRDVTDVISECPLPEPLRGMCAPPTRPAPELAHLY